MQYRPLGRTGQRVSALGLGGESALYKHSDKAVRIIRRALKLGINYFDTAPGYEQSELNFGEVLPSHRREMFMATKTDQRSYDNAWRQFEKSLKRLKVSRVDLLQIHHLSFPEEAKAIFGPRGVVRMIHEAKGQGLTRFVGVTGHHDPDVLLYAIERYPFDACLMSLNPSEVYIHSFQERLLPEAVRRGIGVAAMKVFARGNLFPPIPSTFALLTYALTLPISTAVVGVMNEAQLEANARTVSKFMPFNSSGMRKIEHLTEGLEKEINFYRKGVRGHFPEIHEMPTAVL